ncbi:type VI secretion system lipoprotein TssJ [Azospirillum sp. TSO35-2]|uniref:type VI secretion system lipoprotein TssJ n=1 Tax=Azospirillum sp. TSO35-2 TaxID=716796 RepID=UPI000D6082F2|nr:type VI secretion system lipoprotein TssJ [Azospirillum sp. TSO35-2]PWC37560.1 hypothetical protein TSO352_08435 [Azospirillum sp. TSO35-2]
MIPAFAAVSLTACSSTPTPPPPTTIELTVVGSAALNPDPNGRPSPVMLRLYQLGPSDAFANADFFQIVDQDKATLGPTLLDRQELAVPPDSRQTVTIAPKPEVKTLAVAAAFRAYEEAGWRAMAVIKPNTRNAFVLTAKASKVTLTPPRDDTDGDSAPTEDGAKADDAKAADAKPDDKPAAKDAAIKAVTDPLPAATTNLIVKGAS